MTFDDVWPSSARQLNPGLPTRVDYVAIDGQGQKAKWVFLVCRRGIDAMFAATTQRHITRSRIFVIRVLGPIHSISMRGTAKILRSWRQSNGAS
jgi:hypothetical protein